MQRLATIAGALVALLIMVSTLALYLVQTNWFRERVRERVVSALEQASGGRVELGSFDYQWRTLTAEFGNLVIHGTESAKEQALFRADHLRVGLKIVSVFKRNIDVASVVVVRPRLHLVIAPDGTTNIPAPRGKSIGLAHGSQALLNLKMRHFEVKNGIVEASLRRIPLNFVGDDTSVLMTYNRLTRRYDIRSSVYRIRIKSDPLRPVTGSLEGDAQIGPDALSLRSAVFTSGDSIVRATGTLRRFARPIVDLHLSADIDASDLAQISKVEDAGRGKLSLNGTAHYDETTPITFQGKIAGRNLFYRVRSFDFQGVSFESGLLARKDDLEFTDLKLWALGGRASGRLALRHDRDLQLDGTLSGLNIREAAALFHRKDLPWSAVAGGPFHLRASLDKGWQSLSISSNVTLAPGAGGVPLSGNLNATYQAAGRVLAFDRSSLSSPATHLLFSGVSGKNLDIALDATSLDDADRLAQLFHISTPHLFNGTLLQNGRLHMDGQVSGALSDPQLSMKLDVAHFATQGQVFDRLRSQFTAGTGGIDVASLTLDQGPLHATVAGRAGLEDWIPKNSSPVQFQTQFRGADLAKLAQAFWGVNLRSVRGIASGTLNVQGTLGSPRGVARINVANVDAYGERLNQLDLGATFAGDTLQLTRGHMQAGPAELSFSGAYRHTPNSWKDGRLDFKIDSNGFPLASLAPVRDYQPGLNVDFEIHGQGAAHISPDRIEPLSADGSIVLRDLTLDGVPYGSLRFSAGTRGDRLTTSFSGNLRGSGVTGSAQIAMTHGNPVVGELHLDEIQLSTIAPLIYPQAKLPFDGFLQGGLTFEGPLQQPLKMHGTIGLEKLQVSARSTDEVSGNINSADLTLRNAGPVLFQFADGIAAVSRFELRGGTSDVAVRGSIPFSQQGPIGLNLNGAVDLKIFQLFDPNVRASGESSVAVSIAGTRMNPAVSGAVELRNGTFFANSLPNGLTAVNGRVKFDRDRATIEKLTAQTGGGELSLGGFMTFGHGGPLIYRLDANADNVRVRYGGSVSVTATSRLRLTGTSDNSILSGTTTISRVIFNPNTDIGNLLASTAAPLASPSNEKDFLTGLQFDIHIESAPNLQLSTELSRDVEAEIDLRLHGTPQRPVLLGNITANQGDIRVFGTKYTINRGEVDFVNAVKIEPVLDLDLQTQARGITVDITIAGTPGKLNINYRSDPPLQPRDIIALLTVGRAPNSTSNVPNVSATNDVTALQSGASSVLGQAISPASNRLSKLFGITNIKIDPMVQGITNTPQARLTVEQQISRQITVTYVTNLSQTSEQIFRLEWAFSSQYSLVALRDDNGEFGIDIQYRKRFK